MSDAPPVPVKPSDDDEAVLKAILDTLNQKGTTPIVEFIDELHLADHPAGPEILEQVLGEGMIEMVDDGNKICIGEFGREVLKKIRLERG